MVTFEEHKSNIPTERHGRIAGRSSCLRSTDCRARVCPLEPWKRNTKRRKHERTCYYLREAARAKGTSRGESMNVANPDPGDEARKIASNISRDYILSLSPAELRSSVTRGLDR